MDDIELSLVNYLLTKRPPAALLHATRPNFVCDYAEVGKVLDYMCEHIPPEKPLPDYATLISMMDDDDIADFLKQTVGLEQAEDLEGYSLLFGKRESERQLDRLAYMIQKAWERKDYDAMSRYGEEMGIAGRNGRNRIKPVDSDEFYDVTDILKPETLLSTHISRLNQHLGGYPNGIDFEESGGFSLGEIAIIGGDTNKGKSALASSLWYHFIKMSIDNPNYKSVYVNYEGAYDRFRKTMFAMATGVYPYKRDIELYRSAEQEYRRFMEPRRGNFLLYDGAGGDMPTSTASLEVEIAKRAEDGYKAFFIDTINSIDDRDGKESWHITEGAMRMLERVAKRYELAIIATAQNKQGLQFEDCKWPELKWIGQSAYLQQKAGVAIGIYRADLYSEGTVDYTSLAIMKARHRAVVPKECVNVGWDRNRHMYVPYKGSGTDVVNASKEVQERQILSVLGEEAATAYAN